MLTQRQRLAGLPAALAQRAVAIEQALQQGRLDEAERGVAAALAVAPRHAEILRLHGWTQLRRGRGEAALQTLLQARALRSDDALIHQLIGGAYEATHDFARSREALQRACELAPELASCWFSYGRRLAIDGDADAAIAALQRAVKLAPKHAQARILLANMLRAEGASEQAQAAYRGIIAEYPHSGGQAWWGLAMLKPMPLGSADIEAMRRILAATTASANDRIAIGFALGVALEQQGDFPGAFAVLQATHALARRGEPFDRDAFVGHVDDVLQAFTPPPGTSAAQGHEVIFIVSMPRSGSTLVEQILASHSQVEGGDELPDLLQEIMDESDRVRLAFPHWVRAHSEEQWRTLGQRYLQRTQRWRSRRPRHTDKMPGNWLYTGAILAMLPQARIVVVRRDPLETCLACYRYAFNRHPYTHDFADLATVQQQFDRAARRWQELFPDRVRILVYEEMTAAPEAQIRALLDFCNLPFEQACVDFHVTQRRVITPSAAQVREPIRRDTARAHKYGELLDPLRAQLGLPLFQAEK